MVLSCSASWWLSTGIFFFFGLTSTAWRIRGYSVGVGPVPDVNFVLENEYKLYNALCRRGTSFSGFQPPTERMDL